MLFRREEFLRLLLVALAVLCSLQGRPVGAAGTHTFASARFGYTFSYPASWAALPPPDASTTEIRSPDQATVFSARVTNGSLSSTGMQTVLVQVLAQLLGATSSSAVHPSVSQPAQPGGAAVQAEARGVVNGAHRFAIARVAGLAGYLYLFYGYGPTAPSVAFDAPALALHTIMASVTISAVRLQFSRPTIHFSMYYPKAWHQVSYPALGKIVVDGPGGAVIFADFGREATNAIDLRLLLLENAGLMGKIQGQAGFATATVDGKPVQLLSVRITDKQRHSLLATVADTSLSGFNYVFGGAAPKSSPEQQAVIDAIASVTMRPPALPPDTGAFVPFTSAAHRYSLQRPAAWIASEHDSSTDAVFAARDGDLTMSLLVRTGTPTGVLAQLARTASQGFSGVTQRTAPAQLGALHGTERIIQATLVKGLIQETHIVAAAAGNTVYVLTWSFYTSVPDAATLQQLVRKAQATFKVTS